MSNSQSENGTKSRETSEVFDSETIVPQHRRRAIVDDDTTNGVHVDEEQPLEKGGDGNAGETFDKLPVRAKDVFGDIVGNMLNMLGRCFALFPKLPWESRRENEIKEKDVSSQSQEAFPRQSAPESSSAFPREFPSDALVQAGYGMDHGRRNERFKLKIPPNVAPPPPQHPHPTVRRG